MIRLILIFIIVTFIIAGIVDTINNYIKHKSFTKSEIPNSEYWWYNTPHYYIMSNGEKFNIAEYVTWDEWKNLPKENRIKTCLEIENRINSINKTNNFTKITIN